jgi:hypothetical protein
MQMKRMYLGAVVVLSVVWCAVDARAALLTLDNSTRVTALVSTSYDLSQGGVLDWAYWAPTTTGLTPPVAPTNRKLGGTIISPMNVVGGTTLRGSASSTTVERYNWNDGTSPATGSNASLAGLIFNSDLGSSADGKGLSFTVTGDPLVTRWVNLFLGAFAATGNLSVTLNGATTVLDTQVFANNSPKQIEIYALRFRPDTIGDVLTVQWTASNITDTANGHVGAQAVQVAVPEPGVVGMVVVGFAGMLATRRGRTLG